MVVLLFAAPATAEKFDVRPPGTRPCDAPPAVGPSFLTLSLDLPLAEWLARLDAATPRELGNDEPEPYPRDEGDLLLRYGLRRDSTSAAYDGDRVTLETPIHYWMDVRGEGFEPTGCASADEPILIRSATVTRIGWRNDWRVDAQVVPRALIFATRCKPKPPGVNFTRFLSGRVEERHTQPLASWIVDELGKMDGIERAVRSAWSSLTREKEMRDRALRLALRPSGIRVAPLRFDDGNIHADVAFELHPRVVPASESPDASPLPPLPEPRVRLFDGLMRLPIDVTVPWKELEQRIRNHVDGKTYADRRGEYRVTGVRVSGSGTRAIFALDVEGAVSGAVYLEGSLEYDARERALAFAEIRPTKETLDVLGPRALDEFGPGLRLILRFPVGDVLGLHVEEIGRALNGGWGEGVTVRGGMARWESTTPHVSDEGLGLRAVLTGSAAVTVH